MITNYKNFSLLERNINIEMLSRYDEWWDNFIKKLKKNKPFPVKFNDEFSEVVIDNPRKIINNIVDRKTGKVDKQKAYDFFTEKGVKGSRYNKEVIKLTNGQRIGLNDLMRTWEFGSSAGTSTGTKQTRINETIQAICLSIRYRKKEDITIEDIEYFVDNYNGPDIKYVDKVLKNVGLNVQITEEDLRNNKDWYYTHMTLSNEIYSFLNDDIRYFFYQAFFDIENYLPKVIRNKFYEIMRNMQIDFKIDFAKWNPADIFIVNEEKEKQILERLLLCKDMEELNMVMDEYFNEGSLIGVSLKKLDPNRKMHFVINKQEESNFKYIKSTASISPMASMSVNIHAEVNSTIPTTKDQTMTARIYTGDEESNVVLEIKGSSSKYGKASMSYLNKVLSDVELGPIPSYNSDEIEEMSNDDLKSAIEQYYSILKIGSNSTKGNRSNIEEKRSKLISKYQSLILVNILETNKNKPINSGVVGRFLFALNKKRNKTDYIVKHLFYYAYAMGNEIFENCKYYRIGSND